MKKILATIFLSVILCGPAFAVPYSVMFDADAGGGVYINEQIYGWDLEAIDLLPGINGDFVTVQSLGANNALGNNDTWTEFISLNVSNGLGDGYGALVGGVETGTQGYYNFPTPGAQVYINLSLNGYITGYNSGADAATTATTGNLLDDTWTSVIGGGLGNMFIDTDNNQVYSGADIEIATFGLVDAGDFFMQQSVWTGAGSLLSLALEFNSINSSYFGTAPGEENINSLIGKKWLLAMAQGSVGLEGYSGDNTVNPNVLNFTWTDTGWDARFTTIPEPATFILLGIGLLGAAGVSRRKLS